MTKFFFLTVFFFSFYPAFAQNKFKIKNDKNYKPQNIKFENSELLEKTNWDSIQFEFRFWTIDLATYKHQMYQFHCDYKDQWKAYHYQYCVRISNDLTKIKFNLSKEWKSQFDSLVYLQILNLKDERIAEKKWKFIDGTKPIFVGDGVFYRIDLITKKKNRYFIYSMPEALLKYLILNQHSNKNELVRFNKILQILNRQIDFYKNCIDHDCNKFN